MATGEPSTIEPVRVLFGHTSKETAYLVDDHRQLRCTIRYWVETGVKGSGKGQQRYVYQTANPRKPGESWNKPHASTYALIVLLYLDGNDHVQRWQTTLPTPVDDARMRLMGIHDQLTPELRDYYDGLVKVSQRPGISASSWELWNQTIDAMTQHIWTTGADPEVVDRFWDGPDGKHYVDDEAVYLATARRRVNAVATPSAS